jgi:hypothetical protein
MRIVAAVMEATAAERTLRHLGQEPSASSRIVRADRTGDNRVGIRVATAVPDRA